MPTNARTLSGFRIAQASIIMPPRLWPSRIGFGDQPRPTISS